MGANTNKALLSSEIETHAWNIEIRSYNFFLNYSTKISYDFLWPLRNFLRKLRNKKTSRVGGIFRVGRVTPIQKKKLALFRIAIIQSLFVVKHHRWGEGVNGLILLLLWYEAAMQILPGCSHAACCSGVGGCHVYVSRWAEGGALVMMCYAGCSLAPHVQAADGRSPQRYMLALNLPTPVFFRVNCYLCNKNRHKRSLGYSSFDIIVSKP